MKTRLKSIRRILPVGMFVLFFGLSSCTEEKKSDPQTPNDNAFIVGQWRLKSHITHRNLNGSASDIDDTKSLFILIPCLENTTFVFQSDGKFKFSDSCDWTTAGFYSNEPYSLSVDHTTLLVTDKDKSIHKFKIAINGSMMTIIDGDDIQASKVVMERV